MEFQRIRRLLSCTRRAVDDYNMIEEGDRIAVGVSGGKDSLALLCALYDLKRFYPKNFSLVAVTVNAGFPDMDFTPVKQFCNEMEIPYVIKESGIADVVFNIRQESNPCSLCAKMRRGSLHDAAKEAGCNKVALGHHFDDVVTTFMLNLFHEGRIGCFSPVTYLSRKDLTMIRPLIYADEDDVRYFVRGNDLPLVKNTCPEDKNTERESMKQFIDDLDRKDKGLKHRIFKAIQKGNVDGFHLP
ncbi:MAG: tRNA 2-thiocytidine(32) synthetase TtcA [Ruminococcaceae bacterium]|nr:tRNA 2-thiocytidine(32) synthetase TtcA [Oscillospiraceae bacterium]